VARRAELLQPDIDASTRSVIDIDLDQLRSRGRCPTSPTMSSCCRSGGKHEESSLLMHDEHRSLRAAASSWGGRAISHASLVAPHPDDSMVSGRGLLQRLRRITRAHRDARLARCAGHQAQTRKARRRCRPRPGTSPTGWASTPRSTSAAELAAVWASDGEDSHVERVHAARWPWSRRRGEIYRYMKLRQFLTSATRSRERATPARPFEPGRAIDPEARHLKRHLEHRRPARDARHELRVAQALIRR